MVNFNQSSYGVMEDDGTVTIIMILSQPSSVQFQAIINATDFTAIGIYSLLYYRKTGNFGIVKVWRNLIHGISAKETLTKCWLSRLFCFAL